MNIGKIIKDRRAKLKMSQKELAKKVGVSESAISRYESGDIGSMGIDKATLMAKALSIDPLVFLGGELKILDEPTESIPVYSSISAGQPYHAEENKTGNITIPSEWLKHNDYIALKVSGDSMYPQILDEDIVIVELSTDFVDGDVCCVYVNGYDASIKKVYRTSKGGIKLVPNNTNYAPQTYEQEDETVNIIGKVVEIRRSI